MAWMVSPLGISIIVVVVVAIASLVYWKREPIKTWLRGWRMDEVELGAGPAKAKFKKKAKKDALAPHSARAGVDLGEDGDFTRSKITSAGRDIRRGTAAGSPEEGEAPGVNFGKRGKFRDAEVEAAGRDIADDTKREEA
jgi:hypothetical protein